MTLLDLHFVFIWWIITFVLGIIFYPLTNSLFKNFLDKGYIFSKILGIAITSYLVFFFGTIKLLAFSQNNIALLLIIFVLINYFVLHKIKKLSKLKKDLVVSLKTTWPIYVIEELIFVIVFSFWAHIKTFQPDINGLEKFMDFGILNSILRSDFFPVKDVWLTPFSINYYYFGHLITAVLTKLSGISSNITFNLMQALLFAFCFTSTFSIGLNLHFLLRPKISKGVKYLRLLSSGLLTALLVTTAGNLHILYSFFRAYPNETPVPLWQLNFLPFSFPNQYWYPNATRFIYHTIHEFPMYSWVVSDLHGHVLDIPFVLLIIAFLISILLNKKINYLKIVFISFLTVVLYMTNAWDGIIYLGLGVIIVSYLAFTNSKKITKKTALRFFYSIFFLIAGYFIFSLPFNLSFKPFVSGVGLLCAPNFLTAKGSVGSFLFEANHCQHSPLWQLSILYGFFYFWAILFIAFLFKKLRQKTSKINIVDKFIFILIIFSTILIIVPELVYVKDIYPMHYRANTMFKLVYQAFILLSICSSYIVFRILFIIKTYCVGFKKLLLLTTYSLASLTLISLVLIYPFLSISSYYNDLKIQRGLDGTKYLEMLYPNDYKAILWLNKNIKQQPVILEAQDTSYTDYARVSANTGLPTVLGWTVHEWLWRGSYSVPAPRIEDIRLIYELNDIAKTKKLLQKYNISFVFIGDLERKKYENLNEEKFNTLGKIIYQAGSTKIYSLY